MTHRTEPMNDKAVTVDRKRATEEFTGSRWDRLEQLWVETDQSLRERMKERSNNGSN